MGAINNGGPAFPSTANDMISGQIVDQYLGISLRDYFAGQALAGLSADPNFAIERVAKWAYGLADAMLLERDK